MADIVENDKAVYGFFLIRNQSVSVPMRNMTGLIRNLSQRRKKNEKPIMNQWTV